MTTVSRQLRALAQVGRALFCLSGAYQFLGGVPSAASQEKPAAPAQQQSTKMAPEAGKKATADTGKKATADTGKKATDSVQVRTPDQLDAMVAPIALYPDELLAQTLVASTYPLEIVQLQQWLAKNPGLKDKALADSVAKQPWDPSIQSMAPLPDLVKRLGDDIQWTTELGNAFLAQQADVMTAVQRMRKKAKEKGTLESNEQQKVETQVVEKKEVIVIESANPEVVYVPSYSPAVVYGPPVYPYPPIYYPYYPPGAAFISFGVGMMWGAAMWGGACCYAGWGGGNVYINGGNHFNSIGGVGGVGGVASGVLAALVALAEQVVLGAQVALGAQASLVVLAAQVVLAGPVVPSPRGVAAHGLTTLRIEGAPPTPTSAPPTSSAVKPGVNRGSGARAQGVATERLVEVWDRVELVQAIGLPPAVRDSGEVPAEAIGYPMQAAAGAAIR